METKSWWQSKTLWLNILGAVAVAIQFLADTGDAGMGWTATALVVVNFILRLITTQPIKGLRD